MKFHDETGAEIDVKQFEKGSIVICRVMAPHSPEKFGEFCKAHDWISEDFANRWIKLIFCPDWVEFKDWR